MNATTTQPKLSPARPNFPLALTKALACWVIHGAMFAAVAFVLIGLVPYHNEMYRNFELDLPRGTKQLMAASQWMTRYWYLPAFYFTILNAALFIWLDIAGRRMRWLRITWFAGFLIFASFFLVWVMLALTLPLAGIMWKLSG